MQERIFIVFGLVQDSGLRFQSCYEYNRITILHLPAEKEQGMLKIYDKYIKIGKIPVDEKVWKTFRLNRIPFLDKIKRDA